jgi:hypothetical protein
MTSPEDDAHDRVAVLGTGIMGSPMAPGPTELDSSSPLVLYESIL